MFRLQSGDKDVLRTMVLRIIQTLVIIFLVCLVIATLYTYTANGSDDNNKTSLILDAILYINDDNDAMAAEEDNKTKSKPNVTRTLFLDVNYTILDEETIKEIIRDDYTLTLHVKGNRYSEKIIKPLNDILRVDSFIEIPIINTEKDRDDGSDFRVDVWINDYDRDYQKVNYPIKTNATFKEIDITDMLNTALEDMREEKEEEGEYEQEDEREAEYSIILDRPKNIGDDRPHAKIKDPKDN